MRKRMITRTLTQTTAEIMTVNVLTSEVKTESYTIGGSYDTNDKLLEKLKSIYETPVLKLVNISSMTAEDILIGMDEDDFIRLAKVLPPRIKDKQ